MRKNTLLCILLVFSFSIAAGNYITEFKVRDAIGIRKPVFNDSINLKGESFNTKFLLKSELPIVSDNADFTILQTDTADYLILDKPEKNYAFYVVSFQAKADRFVKAKLKVTSPNYWELYVNDEKKKDKESSEDSLSVAKTITVDLNMEPEVRYDIVLKLLSSSEDVVSPAIKCELVKESKDSLITIQTNPEMKARYGLANTVFGNRVNSVSLSPNGKYLLTRYTDYYALHRSNSYTVLSETRSGKVLLTDQGGRNLIWMPKSNKLYYTVTAERGVDLITLDPATMTEEVLFRELKGGNFTWSPQEDYLIYYPSESAPSESGPLKRIIDPSDRIPNNRSRWFLSKYDIKTGLSEQITFGNHGTSLNDIRSDGKKIIYSTSKNNFIERPFSLSSLFELDLETLEIDTLVFEERFGGRAAYSPDGKTLLLIAGPEAFDKVGMNSGNHPIPNSYDQQAFLMDIATKKINPISRDFDPSLNLVQWNPGDNNIYFNTADKDYRNIYRYLTKESKWEKLDFEVDVVRSVSVADNASYIAYCGVGLSTSTQAYLYDMKKKRSELLADPMKETLEGIEFGEVKDWNFISSDGTTIEGRVCYPPGFDTGKKYPLIVYYYGGTTPTERIMENYYGQHLFASRGYIVYVIQPSGTIGYGQEFSARHVNAWGKRTADDIIEGTKKLCDEYSYIDKTRIGCLGASYGGFMTMYLQTQTDIFAAAMSHAGISNVTSYWGEGYWGVGYNGIAAADSYPWNNPELFTKQGALFNADKVNTPLLLLHGTVDTNVPVGESIQMFNALKVLGKEVELVLIEGEDHHVLDYNKRVLWHNTIMAWFAKWLQDSPQWWNELYPERHL